VRHLGNLGDVDVLTLRGRRLELRRAWPRTADHVVLEYLDADGRPVAGQWLRDSEHRRHVLAATPAPAFVVPGTAVVLQPAGADRKLRGLAAVLGEPGARLVSHRAERRAVVCRGDGCFVKVVRPDRSDAVARSAVRVATALDGRVDVPVLLEHDADRGVLVWSALPGTTLHEQAVRAGSTPQPAAWAAGWRRAGAAVSELHAAQSEGLTSRDVEVERRAATRWIGPARELGLLPSGPDVPEVPAPAAPVDVALHGDLHDKQIVVDSTGAVPRVGLLDVDQLARGEAAIDIANLLVHIELRTRQGLLAPDVAAAARTAFLDGLAPGAETMARVASLSDLIRLRLAGLYAFRPQWRPLARALHEAVLVQV
jgi:hypothetical protein